MSTSNHFVEWNHSYTKAREWSYLVYTHAGCIAENKCYTRISGTYNDLYFTFQAMSSCVEATEGYCSLKYKILNVLSRQNLFHLSGLVIVKWSLYIKLRALFEYGRCKINKAGIFYQAVNFNPSTLRRLGTGKVTWYCSACACIRMCCYALELVEMLSTLFWSLKIIR